VAYYPNFSINLVLLRFLEGWGLDWNHRTGDLTFHKDKEVIGSTKQAYGQYVLKYRKGEAYMHGHMAFVTGIPSRNRNQKRNKPEQKWKRPPSWGNPSLWQRSPGRSPAGQIPTVGLAVVMNWFGIRTMVSRMCVWSSLG
jgi:hypothetical protein